MQVNYFRRMRACLPWPILVSPSSSVQVTSSQRALSSYEEKRGHTQHVNHADHEVPAHTKC